MVSVITLSHPLPSPFPSLSLNSLRELGLYQTEIVLIVLLSGIELLFGIIKMDSSVCQISPDDLLPLSYWLVAKAFLEINIATLLLSFRSCQENCNLCIVVSLWFLSALYFAWNFVGTYLFWCQCLTNYDIGGTFFIVISLLEGLIFSYMNFKIIDFIDNMRYLHPMNAPLIYEYYNSNV